MLPTLPLLIVVEGENDIQFLKAISQMLHHDDVGLPDLGQLTIQRKAIFLPMCGNNLKEWIARISSLHKRAFYLFDRECEPESTSRRQIAQSISPHPGCFAALTSKRSIENYLHPLAIVEACGIHLSFNDETDVASLLARMLLARTGETSWWQLPSKRQRRLHDKAKKILNVNAVQRMTPALLAEQDPNGEVASWLKAIGSLIDL